MGGIWLPAPLCYAPLPTLQIPAEDTGGRRSKLFPTRVTLYGRSLLSMPKLLLTNVTCTQTAFVGMLGSCCQFGSPHLNLVSGVIFG
jgi:hypothetical protein